MSQPDRKSQRHRLAPPYTPGRQRIRAARHPPSSLTASATRRAQKTRALGDATEGASRTGGGPRYARKRQQQCGAGLAPGRLQALHPKRPSMPAFPGYLKSWKYGPIGAKVKAGDVLAEIATQPQPDLRPQQLMQARADLNVAPGQCQACADRSRAVAVAGQHRRCRQARCRPAHVHLETPTSPRSRRRRQKRRSAWSPRKASNALVAPV